MSKANRIWGLLKLQFYSLCAYVVDRLIALVILAVSLVPFCLTHSRVSCDLLSNLMRWKQNKMAAKGESSSDCTPSTYSPLTRKPSGPHSASYSVPQADASSYTHTHPNSHSQYDALPVGTLGTYDPAADEIDYSFYQNARPNRRRLLYSRASSAEPDLEDERGLGDASLLLNGSGRRKNRGKKDLGLRGRNGSELADMSAEDSLMEEAELSTETLYVMLLVLASTAVTMLAAYLILL